MGRYISPNPKIWSGKKSDQQLYLHEKVQCADFEKLQKNPNTNAFAIFGYTCDTVIKSNQRIPQTKAPDEIRKHLARLPNHLSDKTLLIDVGDMDTGDDLDAAQHLLSGKVSSILKRHMTPILLAVGLHMAYGTYQVIKTHLGNSKTIGIINFDACFDLYSHENENTSGASFYEIGQHCKNNGSKFKYFCLGIRKDANDKLLFKSADDWNVFYLERQHFNMYYLEHVQLRLMQFIEDVDYLYTTIDLNGFSTAYTSGDSNSSPLGFSPDIVMECLKLIVDSNKLITFDVTGIRPVSDLNDQTAKLAASLVHYIIHEF